MNDLTVSWMSAGVSSAVATKLAIKDIDEIIYTDIDDQHLDSRRFIKDCVKWFGKPVTQLKSPLASVEGACLAGAYINGENGARCTVTLKKQVRKVWERTKKDVVMTYIWGLDRDEQDRADRLIIAMPDFSHRFPLIENKIDKAEAHRILNASGIKRPLMYDLGYNNNNCVGCVKGGMGYWNKIREDFPHVYKSRALMERKIGASCINGTYLDELDPDRGRMSKPVIDDCGIFCELMAI